MTQFNLFDTTTKRHSYYVKYVSLHSCTNPLLQPPPPSVCCSKSTYRQFACINQSVIDKKKTRDITKFFLWTTFVL